MANKEPVYLIMVTADNHNKFYNCIPNSDDTFTVEYGRVGGHATTKIYPMSKWNTQINSKIKKGYVNCSKLMNDIIADTEVTPTEAKDKFASIVNSSVRKIIKRLWDYANNVVQSSYKVSAATVTQDMVDMAQKKIDELAMTINNKITVDSFNNSLLEIFAIIPRRMKIVSDYLATSEKDFSDIIKREQDTLDAMRGQVYKRKSKDNKKGEGKAITSSKENAFLEDMGIKMEPATDTDIAKIKKAMGDAEHKFYQAWKVTNYETEQKYQDFVSKNKINNIKLTCHGSRNQNWFNILKTGLKIRPAGVITTGNMFGLGLYFSNPDKWHGVAKSIGYTSLNGYWSRESNNTGFLAFFETALGESYDVYSFDSKYTNYDEKKLKTAKPTAWHLFAHGNTNMLRNDEIVIYNEAQTTIRYLVEIRMNKKD